MIVPRHLGLPAAVLLLVVAAPAGAHDFWIEPSTFRPPVEATIGVRLKVGEHFRGEPVPRDPRLVRQFVLVDAGGTTPVAGRPGAEPAGLVRVERAGLAVLGYRSDRSRIDLEAAKFETYLETEGLDAARQARAARGERGVPGREVFSRCAKALFAVGEGAGSEGYDRRLGLGLELVPGRNPYAMRAGDELPVTLEWDGKPLVGALVVALHADASAVTRARTDAAGRVRLRLAPPGPWLVKAVHMIPAQADTGADWESLWASLTFELPTP